MNDIFDFPADADHAARAMPDAVLTGSGALLDGKLSPRGAWIVAGALILGAVLSAAVLTPGRPLVPLFAAAGLLLSLCYQAPPLRASYRGYGLGELCIFAVFGPLPVLGSFYVQTGQLGASALLLGAVFGVGAALVLYCHHFLHWRADRLAGKRSPVAALGPAHAAWLGIVIVAAYCLSASVALYVLRTAPLSALLAGAAPLLLLPPLLGFARERGAPAMRLLSGAFIAYVLSSGVVVVALWRL
jgi:1,4-dihydroxy-2-naphthoate octaprenyltransferase